MKGPFFGLIISILTILFAFYFSPDFVSSYLSPDGILDPSTAVNISFLQMGVGIIGLSGLLSSLLFIIKPSLLDSVKKGINNVINEKFPALWFSGALGVSVFLLIMTYYRPGLIGRLFTLAYENNIASWFSGILLLIISLHAFDGYIRLKQVHPGPARGWAIISLVLLSLSADEGSSIHERANLILGFGTWLSLLPFAIVLAGMMAYALFSLWSVKEERITLRYIILGFFFFGTVALQEFIEHSFEWGSLYNLQVTIEEGTELLGMLILLNVCMKNSRGLFGPKNTKDFHVFESIYLLRIPILFVGLVCVPVFAYLSELLIDVKGGRPADWFAAAIFLFAALAASRNFFKFGQNICLSGWGLTALCILLSVSSVIYQPKYTIDFLSISIYSRMAVFIIVSVLICTIWILSNKYQSKTCIPPVIVMCGVILLSLFKMDLFFLYVMQMLVGLCVYYVHSSYSLSKE